MVLSESTPRFRAFRLGGGWIASGRRHNAPFADVEAEKLIAAAGAPKSLDLTYYDNCVKRSADALRAALPKARKFTHVGSGSAKVEQVASNRRVLGPDGMVKFTRSSATK